MQNERSRPRIQDVAELAGVAAGTVSRVLNASGKVRPKTRSKVLRAIDELRYRRDERGRALRTKRGSQLLVIVPFFTKNLYVEMLRAIDRERHADARHILTVMNVESAEEKKRAFELAAHDSQLAAVISISLTPPEGLASRLQPRIPLVVLDAPSTEFPAVEFDHVFGGYIATKHFLDLGHRRIGFIGRRQDPFVRRGLRLAGYRQALEEADVPRSADYVRVGDYSREDGLRDALELLQLPEPPTAIFAASDLQAIGVLEAARITGLEVPGDLAVLGYNDIEPAGYLGLSAVRLPIDELAHEAMELLEQLWGGETPARRAPLRPKLVLRSSCGWECSWRMR